MDYLRRLAEMGHIRSNALAIAQSERDPSAHGIGLCPVEERHGNSRVGEKPEI